MNVESSKLKSECIHFAFFGKLKNFCLFGSEVFTHTHHQRLNFTFTNTHDAAVREADLSILAFTVRWFDSEPASLVFFSSGTPPPALTR